MRKLLVAYTFIAMLGLVFADTCQDFFDGKPVVEVSSSALTKSDDGTWLFSVGIKTVDKNVFTSGSVTLASVDNKTFKNLRVNQANFSNKEKIITFEFKQEEVIAGQELIVFVSSPGANIGGNLKEPLVRKEFDGSSKEVGQVIPTRLSTRNAFAYSILDAKNEEWVVACFKGFSPGSKAILKSAKAKADTVLEDGSGRIIEKMPSQDNFELIVQSSEGLTALRVKTFIPKALIRTSCTLSFDGEKLSLKTTQKSSETLDVLIKTGLEDIKIQANTSQDTIDFDWKKGEYYLVIASQEGEQICNTTFNTKKGVKINNETKLEKLVEDPRILERKKKEEEQRSLIVMISMSVLSAIVFVWFFTKVTRTKRSHMEEKLDDFGKKK